MSICFLTATVNINTTKHPQRQSVVGRRDADDIQPPFGDLSSSNESQALAARAHAIAITVYAGRLSWPKLKAVYLEATGPEGDLHWVRYCYATEAVAKQLSKVVMPAGIAMWSPPMQYSSLSFDIDLSCKETATCLCEIVVTGSDAMYVTN